MIRPDYGGWVVTSFGRRHERAFPRRRHRQGRAMASGRRPVGGKRGRISVVLHKTELVALGIGHDHDYALVVVVSFAGGPSSQDGNELDSLVDVVDGHVKMDADLPCLRLGNRLEDQPRLGIAAMTQVDPADLRRPRLATEQGAPEARDPLRVHAVDGHSRHEVRHVRHLTVASRCRGAQDQQNAEPIAAREYEGSCPSRCLFALVRLVP
jgi:hypothetical protein